MKYLFFFSIALFFPALVGAQITFDCGPAVWPYGPVSNTVVSEPYGCVSDTIVSEWKSTDKPNACSHDWAYAEHDDLNPIFITSMSDTPTHCGHVDQTTKEGRICRKCLRDETRTTKIVWRDKLSEYMTLKNKKESKQ